MKGIVIKEEKMDEGKFLRLIGVAGLALMVSVLPWGATWPSEIAARQE